MFEIVFVWINTFGVFSDKSSIGRETQVPDAGEDELVDKAADWLVAVEVKETGKEVFISIDGVTF